MQEEILIQTGELKQVKINYLVTARLLYSGMPNEHTFSITNTHEGRTYMIYYPKTSVFITVVKYRFKVVEVNPEYIILKLEKNREAVQTTARIRSKGESKK